MKKLLVTMVVVAMTLTAGAAMAAVTYDFNSGTQGWTITGSGGAWYAPGTDPILPDGAASGSGGGNLHLPDANTAILDLAGIVTGGKTSSFTLQADVYIPNLRPLTGFTFGYPGNMIKNAGIFGVPSNDWAIAVQGNINKGSVQYLDYTSEDWTPHGMDWSMEDFSAASDPEWWDAWVTLKLDYNFSTAGVVKAEAYIPWSLYDGTPPGWLTLYDGAIEASTWMPRPTEITKIAIGSNLKYASWTQAQFDNVIFDSPDLLPVPEPSSLLALGTGLIGLTGVIRRRK